MNLVPFRGEGRTQGVRHCFGVAEIAHVSILCLNETGGARACVADPFVRAKVRPKHELRLARSE